MSLQKNESAFDEPVEVGKGYGTDVFQLMWCLMHQFID